jgi:hypothetical protein
MTENPIPALLTLPGFRRLQNTRIRPRNPDEFQGYGRAHWFKRNGSTMKFCVEMEPREPWLALFSVTLFADDKTGLLPDEVFAIRELMHGAKLTLAEVAIDFSLVTEVNRRFVRRHGVFGKSLRDLPNKNPNVDWWGSKKGGKRVKSYQKDIIAAHRVEFRMRRRFFKKHGVDDLFDFWKFVDLLPGHHIVFVRLDGKRLKAQLRRTWDSRKTAQLMQGVAVLEGDLTAQLSFLRQRAGLKNTRRLLDPLRINGSIRDAFNNWGARWPKKPTGLGKKP